MYTMVKLISIFLMFVYVSSPNTPDECSGKVLTEEQSLKD